MCVFPDSDINGSPCDVWWYIVSPYPMTRDITINARPFVTTLASRRCGDCVVGPVLTFLLCDTNLVFTFFYIFPYVDYTWSSFSSGIVETLCMNVLSALIIKGH